MRWVRFLGLLVIVLMVMGPVLVTAETVFLEYSYSHNDEYPKKDPDPVMSSDDQRYHDFIANLPDRDDYEVGLYAEDPSWDIGHGFIKARIPPDGDLIGYGFYPVGGKERWYSPGGILGVDGKIGRDWEHAWNAKVVYKVNRSTFIEIMHKTRQWKKAWYTLGDNNCVSFVYEIAKIIGETGQQVPVPGADDYIDRPGNLATAIKRTHNSVVNSNSDKKWEMKPDSDGDLWVSAGPPTQKVRGNGDGIDVPAVPAVPEVSRTALETPDDLQKLINDRVGQVPADIQHMAENKRVLLTVTPDPAMQDKVGSQTLGIVFTGTRVSSIDASVDNPDYKVTAKDRALRQILDANDPVLSYRTAIARGDVQITPTGVGENALLSVGGIANKIGLLASPPPYLIKVGDQRDITLDGKPYSILRPKNIILLQEKDKPFATVINSDGITQGYSTAGTAQVIRLSTQQHSLASGVYGDTANDIRTSATSQFVVPQGIGVFSTPAKTSSVPYTVQGGANNAALITGGAGFSYGYGGW
jgi:hypothetical protein